MEQPEIDDIELSSPEGQYDEDEANMVADQDIEPKGFDFDVCSFSFLKIYILFIFVNAFLSLVARIQICNPPQGSGTANSFHTCPHTLRLSFTPEQVCP